jgi:uncharacterized cupredoxin-like copper-binding protein
LVAAGGAALALLTTACPPALAHGAPQAKATAPEQIETAFGRTGDPKRVVRTIDVALHDTMRFDPADLTVRQGDTIRLRVRNSGRVLHELVIGTEDELARHAALMRANPDMEHDAPYMAHVSPGRRGEIVWQFTQAGTFKYGCLVPGHFEAGMVGTIRVVPR